MPFKRHQLNDEETRVYAAGMNARRRGETQPKEELPLAYYKLWRAGWNRIGRTVSTSVYRSGNHNALCAGVHCIHTEVESFDDALKVLDMRQRAKMAAQTQTGRPPTWRQQLGAYKGRQHSPVGHAISAAQSDQASEFERHIIGRVVTAIQSLKLGVEEMSVISAMGVRFPAVNPKSLTDIIISLCHLIKQEPPDFSVQRTPVHPPLRLCIECGAQLEKEDVEYCRHCNPATEHIRIESQLQREHRAKLSGLESDAKQLSKLINKVARKVIEHDDGEGYSRHPGQDAGGMEAGGREGDVVVGGEAAYQSGSGRAGDAES